jgi:hypothetical protein
MASITGGAKLEAKLREISRKVDRKAALAVGFLEGSTYPDGTSTPMVAAIQEFGAPGAGIPARPFFRNMVAEKSGKWGDGVAAQLIATDYDAAAALERVGAGIASQLVQSIKDTNSPALSPVTLMLRKMRADDPSLQVNGSTVAEARAKVEKGDSYAGVSTKPLNDTGHLQNSVDYQVDTE